MLLFAVVLSLLCILYMISKLASVPLSDHFLFDKHHSGSEAGTTIASLYRKHSADIEVFELLCTKTAAPQSVLRHGAYTGPSRIRDSEISPIHQTHWLFLYHAKAQDKRKRILWGSPYSLYCKNQKSWCRTHPAEERQDDDVVHFIGRHE